MVNLTLEQKKQFMVRLVDKVINEQNLDAIDHLVADDFIEHVPFPGQGPGPEGLKYAIGTLINGFPDIHWENELSTPQPVEMKSSERATIFILPNRRRPQYSRAA